MRFVFSCLTLVSALSMSRGSRGGTNSRNFFVSASRLLKPGVISPVGVNQDFYAAALRNASVPIVVVTGPAGSGKTLLACDLFAQRYAAGNLTRLVLTRPYVPVDGESLGFLPGSVHKKMEPWTHPLFDILQMYFSKVQLDSMMKSGVIDVVPLGFMRGRTFHHTLVIADEMQNASPSQMLMLLTRMGRESKLVITGDLAQSDLPVVAPGAKNGLQDLVTRLASYPFDDICHVGLTANDVQRSLVVARILTSLYSNNE